jgi:hypothetical protein
MSSTIQTNAVAGMNTLTAGLWKVKIELDLDVVSTGGDVRNPTLYIRFGGKSAVDGTTQNYICSNNINISSYDTQPSGIFSHYTAIMPIYIYDKTGITDNNNSIYDQMIANSFSSALIRLSFFGSASSTEMTIDMDNIKISATKSPILDLSFEGSGNEPTNMFSNVSMPSLVTVSNQDFTTLGKSNGTGAAAAGTIGRFGASAQTALANNVDVKPAPLADALMSVNSLASGKWNIKIDLDLDVVSNGSDSRNPIAYVRFVGKSAIDGTTKNYVCVNNIQLSSSDTQAVGTFGHYTTTVPIYIYDETGIVDNANGIEDQMVKNNFTAALFRLSFLNQLQVRFR